METTRSFRDSALQAVALIGLILVLMLGAWGIILLAFNLPTIASNVGSSVVSLFAVSSSSPATTTPQTVTNNNSTTTVVVANPPVTHVTPPVIHTTPGTTYVPAQHTTQLYGNADLAVRILSVTPAAANYGSPSRVSVQFEVSNVGTNVAPAGWTISANLPVGYSYLYNSGVQQALNPGDKIVYTMGFNTATQNQYCNQQYPNANCPWYQAPYQSYPFGV
jgi:hypothetical protein